MDGSFNRTVIALLLGFLIWAEDDGSNLSINRWINVSVSEVETKIDIHAYVLTVSEERWTSSSTLLSQAGLNPIRLVPIPLDASIMVLDGEFIKYPKRDKFRKYHSGKLTSISIWKQIAYDSSLDNNHGFSLIFEDDVALHPSVNISDVRAIIEYTASLSRDAGMFFLGLCAPKCRIQSVESNSIKYNECVGPCLHAYGVFKWRAEWLYEELAAIIGDRFRNHLYFHCMDRYTSEGLPSLLGDGPWPYLAGADLSSSELSHKGIFFQDRKTFQSEADPGNN